MLLFSQLSVMDTSILSVICDGFFLLCQLSVMDVSILSVVCDVYFYFISCL